jgi:hypothetical protein
LGALPTWVGVELTMAPSTAGFFSVGSPSSQRAASAASASVTPSPRFFSWVALLMAPVLEFTSILTIV